MKTILLILAAVTGLWGRSYRTTFPLTQNPISENGAWVDGRTISFPGVQTTGGAAFGVNDGSGFDPIAILTPTTWGTAQWAQGTVTLPNGVTPPLASGIYEEVEFHLHLSYLGSQSISGYEIGFGTNTNNPNGSQYVFIVRDDPTSFCYIHETFPSSVNAPTNTGCTPNVANNVNITINNGDVFLASVDTNGIFNVYQNGTLIMSGADTTYSGGAPGIGFNSGETTHYGDNGWSSFQAGDNTCPADASYVNSATNQLVTLASLGITTTCYYIGGGIGTFSTGASDSNSGTDEAHPWLHVPGMRSCTSNCLTVMNAFPQAGTGFILRGGDTWHFGSGVEPSAGSLNNGGWAPYGNGNWNKQTLANPLYIGVDKSWFTGASWTRPSWNGDNPICGPQTVGLTNFPNVTTVSIPGTTCNSAILQTGIPIYANLPQYYVGQCTYPYQWVLNSQGIAIEAGGPFIGISGKGNILSDNIEVSGFCQPAAAGTGTLVWFHWSNASNIQWLNLYVHGWTHEKFAGIVGDCPDGQSGTQPCNSFYGFEGTGDGTFPSDIWRYVVIDGSDSDPIAMFNGYHADMYDVAFSYANNFGDFINSGFHVFHDNLFENWYENGHGNVYESLGDHAGVNVFYNNVIRHINVLNNKDDPFVSLQPLLGTTDYVFNNTFFDVHMSQYFGAQGNVGVTTGNYKLFNNLFQSAPTWSSVIGCGGSPTALWIENHLAINDGAGIVSTSECGPYLQNGAPVTSTGWTEMQANGFNYVQSGTYAYTPPPGGPTVGTGTNENSHFCAEIHTAAMSDSSLADADAACHNDTTYGPVYNSTTHTIAFGITARTSVPRPTSGNWDQGPYQFTGTSVTCGGVDDTAAIATAATTPGVYQFPANGLCIFNGPATSWSVAGVTWIGNGTTLKQKVGDTHVLLAFQGANNLNISGFTIDANGVTQGNSGPLLLYMQDMTGVSIKGNTFLNSGAGLPNLLGILPYRTSGTISGNTLQSTITGIQILNDSGNVANNMTISSNTLTGSKHNGIQSKNGIAGLVVNITENIISNVTGVDSGAGECGSNTGECGNAIDIFNQPAGVVVSGNNVNTTQWSCVRLNNSSGESVLSNRCTNINEQAIYCAEFGGQGNTCNGNVLINVQEGIVDTNIGAPGSGWMPATINDNSVTNSRSVCYEIQNATATGNVCNGAPIGFDVGFGSTGYGNNVSGNSISNVTIPVLVSKDLSATPANSIGPNAISSVVINSPATPVIFNGGWLVVSNITNANPAVVTYSGTDPFTGGIPGNGESFIFLSVYGMTQINGQLCIIANATATTFQCGGSAPINSLGYGAFAPNPPGNVQAVANLVYAPSGTTLPYSTPSVVTVAPVLMTSVSSHDFGTGRPPSFTITLTNPLASSVAINSILAPGDTTGNILTPGTNLNAAVQAAPAGTVFTIGSGTHHNQSITPKTGDVFVGQPGAIMSGSITLSTWTQPGGPGTPYVDSSGYTPVAGQPFGMCDANHPACGYLEDLFYTSAGVTTIKHRVLPGTGCSASVTAAGAGSWCFDTATGNVYTFDNPTTAGLTVEMSTTQTAFGGSATGVVISGLTIDKYADFAENGAIGFGGGMNWIVTNTEVRYSHGNGIELRSGWSTIGDFSHHNGEGGIGGDGSSMLIQASELSFNNQAGFDCNWGCGGAKISQAVIYNALGNYVHDNLGTGLWDDIGSINVLIDSNYVANNSNALASTGNIGIIDEIGYTTTITNNNIVTNNGIGIFFSTSQNATVANNTLVDNGTSLNASGPINLLQDGSRGSGSIGAYAMTDNYIHDNQFSNTITGHTIYLANEGWINGGAPTGNVMDHNFYHDSTGSGFAYNSPTVLSFATWQANTGFDATSTLDTATLTVPAAPSASALSREFRQTNNCPATLGANASCSITVTFSPTVSGKRTAALTISSNTTPVTQSVILTGTGSGAPPSSCTLTLLWAGTC